MVKYWTEFFEDNGVSRCTFCLDTRLKDDDPCEDCANDDHNFLPVTKQEGNGKPVVYNDGKEDHCCCCHFHFITTDEDVAQALASIRDAVTRNASTRSVDSVTGPER